jgi:nucleotide-binding universal stress UspA family protein
MDWARIMVPLAGGEGDRRALAAGAKIADLFGAELAAVYAPPDISDLIPWMGDGYMGGVQPSALDSLREAAAAGETAAKAAVDAEPYARTTFVSLGSPVWAALAMEGRLSDLVVFDDASARGKSALAQAFQQIVADEQRPTFVARQNMDVGGLAALAWDGGKEASRAARTALPLLQKAGRVVILAAPASSARYFEPARLQDFFTERGIRSEVQTLTDSGDPGLALLRTAKSLEANFLVVGAFGHPRLQEYIFGGTTRAFLHASDGPSLFLSH